MENKLGVRVSTYALFLPELKESASFGEPKPDPKEPLPEKPVVAPVGEDKPKKAPEPHSDPPVKLPQEEHPLELASRSLVGRGEMSSSPKLTSCASTLLCPSPPLQPRGKLAVFTAEVRCGLNSFPFLISIHSPAPSRTGHPLLCCQHDPGSQVPYWKTLPISHLYLSLPNVSLLPDSGDYWLSDTVVRQLL